MKNYGRVIGYGLCLISFSDRTVPFLLSLCTYYLKDIYWKCTRGMWNTMLFIWNRIQSRHFRLSRAEHPLLTYSKFTRESNSRRYSLDVSLNGSRTLMSLVSSRKFCFRAFPPPEKRISKLNRISRRSIRLLFSGYFDKVFRQVYFFFVCLVFALNRLLSPQQSSICLYFYSILYSKVPSERREAFSRDDMDYKRELLLLTLLLVSLSLLFLFFFSTGFVCW